MTEKQERNLFKVPLGSNYKMRHYQQEGLYTRGALVAEKPAMLLLDLIGKYNPRVATLRSITLDDLSKDPTLLAGEFVYIRGQELEVRMRPCGYIAGGSLSGRPGSDRDRWVYFMKVSLPAGDKIIVGVNSQGLDNHSVNEVLDEIIRTTEIRELDSQPSDVERYMRKRIA